MTANQIRALDDAALYELSLQKGRRCNASTDARTAQRIICERSGVELKKRTSLEKAPRYDGCDSYDPEHGWCHNREEE